MVVVVIIAILSVVAVAAYTKYMRNARRQEAMAMLGDIRIKQETFYQTYSQYVDTGGPPPGGGEDLWYPTTEVDNDPNQLKWEYTCDSVSMGIWSNEQAWCQLGIRPTNEVFSFQYFSNGWQSGEVFPGSSYVDQNPTTGLPYMDTTKPYWYAVARGEKDKRGRYNLVMVITSSIREPISWNPEYVY